MGPLSGRCPVRIARDNGPKLRSPVHLFPAAALAFHHGCLFSPVGTIGSSRGCKPPETLPGRPWKACPYPHPSPPPTLCRWGNDWQATKEAREKPLPADPVSVEAMSRHEVHRHGIGGACVRGASTVAFNHASTDAGSEEARDVGKDKALEGHRTAGTSKTRTCLIRWLDELVSRDDPRRHHEDGRLLVHRDRDHLRRRVVCRFLERVFAVRPC